MVVTIDLARSTQRIGSLQNDKQELLATLRNLIENPDFQPDKHPEVLGLIDRVCVTFILLCLHLCTDGLQDDLQVPN